jgi:polysaccharide export outer membrane protein
MIRIFALLQFVLWSCFLTQVPEAARAQTPSRAAAAGAQKPLAPTDVLGVGDEITLDEFDVEEFNTRVFQVGSDGSIGLPLVGRMLAAGLTFSEFEQALDDKLRRFVKDPRATITSAKYHSRSVTVIGAVKDPGTFQISEPRSLLEMLSMAGGLRPDAGSWLRVTRKGQYGRIETSAPDVDFSAGVTEARVPIAPLMDGTRPSLNLTVMPNDIISVAKAEMVYVVGDVKKQGAFVLGDHEQLSLIKLLSLAEGLQSTASPGQSRVIHESDGTRSETPVDVQKILHGKADDVMLKADDILFVPTSTGKKMAYRAIEAAIQTGTGIIIWRR